MADEVLSKPEVRVPGQEFFRREIVRAIAGDNESSQLANHVERPGAQVNIFIPRRSSFKRFSPALIRSGQASLFEYMEVFNNRQRLHSTVRHEAPLAFETSANA